MSSEWCFGSKSVLLLAFVKYMLCGHCTQNCIFLYVLEDKNLCFVTKSCSKSSYNRIFILSWKQHNWFEKSLHNSGMVCVVESSLTPWWIAFLMLYRLVFNIRSHFYELILAWSAYFETFLKHKILFEKYFWRGGYPWLQLEEVVVKKTFCFFLLENIV